MIQPFKLGEPRRRYPLITLLLSLISPGLGLLYCGRLRSAIAIMSVIILSLLAIAFASEPTSKISLMALYVAIYVGQVIWGVIVAFKTGKNYILQRFNRAIIYALFFMIFAGFSEIDDNYLTQVMAVETTNMYPRLAEGDIVIVNRLCYRMTEPQTGDVVFYYPDSLADLLHLGRIIALPNDNVMLTEGVFHVNGQIVPGASPDKDLLISSVPQMVNCPEIWLAENQYFIAGDNHKTAYDSRFTGSVDRELITGRVEAVLYSAQWHKPLLGYHP